MDHIQEKDIKTHVTIIGWALILTNALLVFVGAGALVLLAGIGLFSADAQAFSILTLVGLGAGGLTALLGVPGIIAGWGLLAHQNWARILAIVVAALGLFNFPVGTLVGIYVLWVLLQRSAEVYFGTNV